MYKKFIKHAKKVAKDITDEKARPVLEGVLHLVNGDAAATNSHVLYYAKEIHDKELQEDAVITPGGKTLDLEYPNIERLIPKEFNFSESIKTDEFIKAIDLIHVAGRVSKEDTIMEFNKNTLFSETEGVTAKYSLSTEIPEERKFSSNAAYWLDALRMFKDFGYAEVELNLTGKLRPFTLVSPDEKIMALILPVRRY